MIKNIDNLVRVEELSNDDMHELCIELTHSVYKHGDVYGSSFILEQYVNVSPLILFTYLSSPQLISQWSYAFRQAAIIDQQIVSVVDQQTQEQWQWHRVIHDAVQSIDYFWYRAPFDQVLISDSVRVVCAQKSLKKPGAILLWAVNVNPNNKQTMNIAGLEDWRYLAAIKRIEMDNICKIVEFTNTSQHSETRQ